MENTLKALEIFINKEVGQDELRKVFSKLYYNYSRMMISNVLKTDDHTQIPENADDELYFLNRLIQILDGDFEISEICKDHLNIH